MTPTDNGSSGKDTSHRGSWFCLKGKTRWHTEAHREYGVAWSMCGIRVLTQQIESRPELEEGALPCVRCQGVRR